MKNEGIFSPEKRTRRSSLLRSPELERGETKRPIEEDFNFKSETRHLRIGNRGMDVYVSIKYYDTLPFELTKDEKEHFLEITEDVNGRQRKVYFYVYGQIPEKNEQGGISEEVESMSYGVAEPRHYRSVLNPEYFWSDDRTTSILQEAIIRHSGADAVTAHESAQKIINAMRSRNVMAVEREMSRYPKEVADGIVSETELSFTPKPTIMQEGELIEWIQKKNILFYTGAGISVGGGVMSMGELYNRLGVNQDVQVDGFVNQAINNPEMLVETWSNFIKSASYNMGTKAHAAIANLARTKGCSILTENVDLLQENVGTKAVHITGSWLRDNVSSEDLKQVDAVITVGLNSDNRGFLNWYKKHNPKGKIIAIQIARPPYLGDEDYLILGDCQQILPNVETRIG